MLAQGTSASVSSCSVRLCPSAGSSAINSLRLCKNVCVYLFHDLIKTQRFRVSIYVTSCSWLEPCPRHSGEQIECNDNRMNCWNETFQNLQVKHKVNKINRLMSVCKTHNTSLKMYINKPIKTASSAIHAGIDSELNYSREFNDKVAWELKIELKFRFYRNCM